uniref:Lipoprotein n=1 Tax=Strongyloides papillosus TaxID=174720 RepID=A0A0N5BMD9_STREA
MWTQGIGSVVLQTTNELTVEMSVSIKNYYYSRLLVSATIYETGRDGAIKSRIPYSKQVNQQEFNNGLAVNYKQMVLQLKFKE